MADDQEFLEFIRENVRSVWALELLLLLKRDPPRSWQRAELVRELRANDNLVSQNLEIFERNGLAISDEKGWRFAPANATIEALTARLAQAYKDRPVATMNLIARTDQIKSLSDAFKLRRDDQ